MDLTVAALFVESGGSYFGLPGVDPWDEARDAMLYGGPHPVVAHPPCARWCSLAGLVEARWGHRRGEDGGMFEHALYCVRRFGGVLEHPAHSAAWARFDLPQPSRHGGWQRGLCGGWSCHVEQGRYGHPAKKATWLYAYGTDLPSLKWGYSPTSDEYQAIVGRCRNMSKADDDRPRIGGAAASKTPPEFLDVLLAIARSAHNHG